MLPNGVTKIESSRWQRIAAITEDRFEDYREKPASGYSSYLVFSPGVKWNLCPSFIVEQATRFTQWTTPSLVTLVTCATGLRPGDQLLVVSKSPFLNFMASLQNLPDSPE